MYLCSHVSWMAGSSSNTPPQDAEREKTQYKKVKIKKRKKITKNQKDQDYHDEIKRVSKVGVHEYVGSHVGSWDPCGNERAIGEVLTYEMMADVDMFGSGGDGVCACNGAGTLVIA